MATRHVDSTVTEHVLVPVDGSPQSQHALQYALRMPDVSVTAITVLNPFDVNPLKPGYQSPLGKSGMPAYSQEWYQKQWDEARALHERVREEVAEFDGEFESVVKFGQAERQILDYVDAHDVDHVVIGATGETGLSRLLMGSTADAVTRRSPVTVTVVR